MCTIEIGWELETGNTANMAFDYYTGYQADDADLASALADVLLPICEDGLLRGVEECDDNNSLNMDG